MNQNRKLPVKLGTWFLRNYIIPLATALMIVIFVSCFHLWKNWQIGRAVQVNSLSEIASLMTTAIPQKNRVLMETAMSTARWGLESPAIYLCLNEQIIVSSGQALLSCDEKPPKGFTLLKESIPGFQDYILYAFVPFFSKGSQFFFVLVITILLLLFCVFLTFSIQRKLVRKVIIPLQNGVMDQNNYEIEELEKLRRVQEELLTTKVSLAVSEAIFKQNQQVAHDVRSPLSALEMMLSLIHEVPEDKRLLLRNAVNRIKDIANSLSNRESTLNIVSPTSEALMVSSEECSLILLVQLLESIVSEKRIQYLDLKNVEIEFYFTKDNYSLFALAQPIELKRIISNIINNSIESFATGVGKVIVELSEIDSQIQISVRDNGRGIPSSILHKLGERGMTYNKPNGSGLGLSHAKSSLANWGGSLKITSVENSGTEVRCLIPLHSPPAWFVSKLPIRPNMRIIILDDNQSIHDLWKKKFCDEAPAATLIHTYTPMELRKAYSANFSEIEEVLFLIDYEIAGFVETGLQLIEELGIQQFSVLVTSRYDDAPIKARCEKSNIKLLAKAALTSL